MALGRLNGKLKQADARKLLRDLMHLPSWIEDALKLESDVKELARELMHSQDFLYLGRGLNYPIALEGALKLKEISYIHAEGYPAGEMKHGPIALIDEKMPELCWRREIAISRKRSAISRKSNPAAAK